MVNFRNRSISSEPSNLQVTTSSTYHEMLSEWSFEWSLYLTELTVKDEWKVTWHDSQTGWNKIQQTSNFILIDSNIVLKLRSNILRFSSIRHSRLWLLGPLVLLLPKTLTLFSFPIYRRWAYIMKVIPERVARSKLYIYVLYYLPVYKMINTTGSTSGAGIVYPSGAPEFTPGF